MVVPLVSVRKKGVRKKPAVSVVSVVSVSLVIAKMHAYSS